MKNYTTVVFIVCKMEFEFTDDQLLIEGENIGFRHTIGEVIEHEGVLVVRLDPPGSVSDETNVIGVDHDGNKLWEVEKPEGHFRESFFRSIQKDDGNVLLRNWNSFEYHLDLSDGSIEEVGKWDR